MKKIKNTNRLLLESGFSRKEIKETKKNAEFFKIDLITSVRDIGKRTIRASIILGLVLIIFTVETSVKNGISSFGIIVLLFLMIAIPSYYFTAMRLYIKSALFFINETKKQK